MGDRTERLKRAIHVGRVARRSGLLRESFAFARSRVTALRAERVRAKPARSIGKGRNVVVRVRWRLRRPRTRQSGLRLERLRLL
jgi:hypothetical protein